MAPTLCHNDLVLVRRRSRVSVNEVVVVDSPPVGYVVKRVSIISKGYLRLQGDNPRLDSSVCGKDILLDSLVGTVFLRLRHKKLRILGHSIVARLGVHLI